MRKIISVLALLVAVSARGAVPEPISFLHPESDSAYETLFGRTKAAAKAFFSGLKKAGLVSDLFRTNGESSFSPGLLFSQLHPAPLKEIEGCRAVFCRDVELQKTLNDEMKRGRLVLVANADSGFVAAIVAQTAETKALQDVLTPDLKNRPKNVLIVTPKTLMSTLAHEMTHAEDDETGQLKPLSERIGTLYRKGRLTAEQGRAVQQFAGEVRAYEKEMRYLVDHARKIEFVADEGADEKNPGVEVSTTGKRDFLMRRLSEIDWKVRDWYLPAFLKALGGKKLPAGERKGILATVRGLLPIQGPYSFSSLVQPSL